MICNSVFEKYEFLIAIIIFWFVLLISSAAASDLDCNVAFSKCELKARSTKINTPCDEAIRCEALALCNLEYCICRQAGGLGNDVDPALKEHAQIMCGLTHGRVGKCENIAKKCIAFMKNQYNENHGNQGGSNKPPKPPKQDDCNPNFDPANIKGENDRPCIR